MTLKTLGYNMLTDENGQVTAFDYWHSLEFETFAIIVTGLLLHYYNGQVLN